MNLYLDDDFKPDYLKWIVEIDSEEYYVNMARAWFFATALAKQYDVTLPFFAERKLDKWTHNKSIQKAIESYRVSKEQKDYLKTLRI
jgi:3-methyladenine DNA glycosylase AlkD